jgi:uncharacterized protein YabE (DUF348 family)
MRRSPARLALHAAALTALVGGTTAFVSFDKTVTVTVDGQERKVRSFARTVGDVLDHEGIRVGRHDLVAPSRGTAVADGGEVTVRFGRPLDVLLDGQRRKVWVTAGFVGDALAQLGVRGGDAWVSASRSLPIGRSGLALQVRQPHEVTFLADGSRHTVQTTSPTVREAMIEAGLGLHSTDKISADLTAYPKDGQVVSITRISGQLLVKEKPTPFKVVRKASASLYKGQTAVSRKGQVGVRVLTYRKVFVNGKLSTHRLVRQADTQPAIDQIVLVGTRPRPKGPVPSPDGLNWAALARCESGGNPRAVNGSGPYYGLYQFLASTWHAVGGSGVPTQASSSEQTARAQMLYRRSGAGQWPVCGRLLYS